MIDIPIGLPDAGQRSCDVEARRLLGASVFMGARRNLLDFDSQATANKYYWTHEGERSGISVQLWGIREKIREVDGYITPELQRHTQEAHPELVFRRLNRQQKLCSKMSEAGRKQRVELLKANGFHRIEHWLDWRHGTGIGRDDLIDACACAIAARDSTCFVGSSDRDSRGLLMQIHY
jgi:predicted RNase H-like nuclease